MKLRVFSSSPAPTEIPAGDAGNYFGKYLFVPVEGESNLLECDVKDDAAIEFFLGTGNFVAADAPKKPKAEKGKAAEAPAGGTGDGAGGNQSS